MADRKRWFKVWSSITHDPHFQELQLEDIGRWTLLGALMVGSGDRGRLRSPAGARVLCSVLRVGTPEDAKACLERLPNVRVEEGGNRHGEFAVTIEKWTKYQEDSTQAARQKASRSKRRGEERRGEEENPPVVPHGETWPSPESLVSLYNAQAPDECPEVTKLSPARRKKAKAYLAVFPDRAFWEETCAQIRSSRFLRGLTPPRPGHENFTADFDWLLTKGKDGSENCVKVYEGKYRD